ncbi:hypothetical protein DY000_02052910 [Brassica cretica]|uniref:Legume lectin domain-containing protein n=1 Tax=Brassica cretica TaxID=69181 RepID=A0ABQ7AHW4_BRACR|nr:hypothetical protein DY000_02052910 [Brassica cretica]
MHKIIGSLVIPFIDLEAGINAGAGAGAFLNRNLEAGVLPEVWLTFPNQFFPYFSISSSNSGNNLCTQVNQSCSFSAGFPWARHRSSNPSFPSSSYVLTVFEPGGEQISPG